MTHCENEGYCGPHHDDIEESRMLPVEDLLRPLRSLIRLGKSPEQIACEMGHPAWLFDKYLRKRNTHAPAVLVRHLETLLPPNDSTYAIAA